MQYHSEEHLERKAEFNRVLIIAAQGAQQLLIVTPDKMDTLEDYLKVAFGEKPAKELRSKKLLKVNEGLTVFLEGKKDASGFSKGNVFLPWASMTTVDRAVKDYRATNTFFIPHSGPDSGPGTKDELALYLSNYPSSQPV